MKKVLILRFSSIGDIVLTTPVIRCLKLQTKMEVHYLTKAKFLPLLEANPYLDKVYSFEKNLLDILPSLKKENYDLIIDLHKNLRSLHTRIALGFPKTYSFNKLNFEKWLMVNLKINRLPNLHIVDRYLETTKSLGVKNDGGGLDYFFPDFDKDFLLKELPEKYIAFAIGAAHATKRLPTERIIQLSDLQKLPIVLLGGKDVEKEGIAIQQKSQAQIINLCGKIDLHQSAFCLKSAQKVFTHDTGMMHIAAAFQKEIVSIWGNTIPAFGMYPYYKDGIDKNTFLENKNLDCRPCSKIGYKQCPKGHFKCMKELDFSNLENK